MGNRLTKNSTSYSYDDANQLTSAGGTTYGYDNNGNQTSRGADAFTWDHEDRLTRATVAGATTTYAYNGDGLRMSKTTAGVTTSYTWDVAAGLPVILQAGTNTYRLPPRPRLDGKSGRRRRRSWHEDSARNLPDL